MPRVGALFGFNGIDPALVEQVRERSGGSGPVLAVVSGPSSGRDRVRWQAYGALMAATSPFLDSEIVAVRDPGPVERKRIIRLLPGRTIVEVHAVGRRATAVERAPVVADD